MMTTDRVELVGSYTTPEVKKAVQEEAAELTKQEGHRVSVSSLLHRILVDRYARRISNPPQAPRREHVDHQPTGCERD